MIPNRPIVSLALAFLAAIPLTALSAIIVGWVTELFRDDDRWT